MRPILTSSRNDLIQSAKRLKGAAERRKSGLALLDGRKLLEEAVSCGLEVRQVFVDKEKENRYTAILESAEQSGAQVILATGSLIDAISDVPSSQGIVSICSLPEEKPMLYPMAALCGIQDPGNVGTILRTAEAAGFGGILLDRDCADPFSQKTLRSAMGSAFRMPFRRIEELSAVLKEMRDREGARILSTALDGTPFYARGKDCIRSVLVIGSEGHGISADVAAVSTRKLRLPMAGKTESLNAASAASIMLYDIAKDLFFTGEPQKGEKCGLF